MTNIHADASGLELHEDKRIKQPVRAASVANVTVAGPGSTLDGVTLANGDRILLKNQSTPSQNGIYVFNGAAVAATRATDADVAADFFYLFHVGVREGTVNAATEWLFTQTAAITLGTTSLTFVKISNPLIQEIDAAPSSTYATIKFPNGTLTDNADTSVTYIPYEAVAAKLFLARTYL